MPLEIEAVLQVTDNGVERPLDTADLRDPASARETTLGAVATHATEIRDQLDTANTRLGQLAADATVTAVRDRLPSDNGRLAVRLDAGTVAALTPPAPGPVTISNWP